MSKIENTPAVDPLYFSRRVTTLHNNMDREGPTRAAETAHIGWRQLDPIETANLGVSERPPVYAALGRVVNIMGAADRKRSTRDKLTFDPAPVQLEAALDRADLGLRTPGVKLGEVRHSLDNALDLSESLAGQRGVEAKKLSFNYISARAMELHVTAREIQGNQKLNAGAKRNLTGVVQSSIWGLAKETVELARNVSAEAGRLKSVGKHPGSLPGKSVEAMYLAYRLLDWHAAEAPSEGYSRFGVTREDIPLSRPPGLPRNVDIVTRIGADVTELVQVKAVKHGDKPPQYAPGITVWAPEKHAIDNAAQILGWFDTVINNDASDGAIAAARHNLNTYFAQAHHTY